MKHEYRYTEHLSCSCADSSPSSLDSEADPSSAEVIDTRQEAGYDTAWDNWKSVRDVVDPSQTIFF